MKISAVVLNWNRPDDTVKAVNSILHQDYPDFEVIIWDNASSDNSKSILTGTFGANPRVKMIFAHRNFGVAGGRNRASRETTGEILFFLDSDASIQTPTALTQVVARLARDPDVGALSFEVIRSDGFLMWPFSRPVNEWRHKEFEAARVDGCAFAVRRIAFDKAGAFAEHFSPYGAEDLHFAYKLFDCEYKILYFPSAVAVHAFSPAGRTGIQFTMHVRNMLLIPLELFPVPHAYASFVKIAASLGRDAWVQYQRRDYLRGVREALGSFTFLERIPILRENWRNLRKLVNEEKRLRAKEHDRKGRKPCV
jgi:GT2 family glycosyltransferase